MLSFVFGVIDFMPPVDLSSGAAAAALAADGTETCISRDFRLAFCFVCVCATVHVHHPFSDKLTVLVLNAVGAVSLCVYVWCVYMQKQK